MREKKRKLQFTQWQQLLKKGWGNCAPGTAGVQVGFSPGFNVGVWEIFQDSEITGDERCRNKFKISLSLPQAKFAFINSQSLDQLTVGQAKDTDAMTTLEFDEFKECIARCALDKYKPIRQMSAAVMITSFCKNLLGEENTEECMNTATLIKAERYNWKRYSQTLPGQPLKEHKKWLEVWQRLELTDMYYFPLWEKGVHDCLQKHQKELMKCFLGYTRSIWENNARGERGKSTAPASHRSNIPHAEHGAEHARGGGERSVPPPPRPKLHKSLEASGTSAIQAPPRRPPMPVMMYKCISTPPPSWGTALPSAVHGTISRTLTRWTFLRCGRERPPPPPPWSAPKPSPLPPSPPS